MVASFVGYWSRDNGSSNNYDLTGLPAGVQTGDLLVALVRAQATPTSWTTFGSTQNGAFYKFATGTNDTFYPTNDSLLIVAAWRGISPASIPSLSYSGYAGSSSVSAYTPSTYNITVAVGKHGYPYVGGSSTPSPSDLFTPSSGWPSVAVNSNLYVAHAIETPGVAQPSRTVRLQSGRNDGSIAFLRFVLANSAPNAPAVSVPSSIDRAGINTISVPFSDPDPGDSQSQLDIQWWDSATLGGARVGAVHTYTQASPVQYWDSPPSTFTAGPKELQARSYDAQGKDGPWSTSVFFTAGDAPDGLVITDPLNGATVGQNVLLKWSTPVQDAYEVQVLDGATVVSDTGEVTDAGARQYPLTFPTNSVTRTIQGRRKYGGLWQAQWTSITVSVSYTAPAAPTVTLTSDPANGRLLVTVTNPAPSGGQPAVAYNDIRADDLDGKGFGYKFGSRMVAANGTWVYWLPRAGIDTVIEVAAVGVNGTQTVVTATYTPPVTPPVDPPPSGTAYTDNGNGTWSATPTDNGNDTWTSATPTDNGNGTWSAP